MGLFSCVCVLNNGRKIPREGLLGMQSLCPRGCHMPGLAPPALPFSRATQVDLGVQIPQSCWNNSLGWFWFFLVAADGILQIRVVVSSLSLQMGIIILSIFRGL